MELFGATKPRRSEEQAKRPKVFTLEHANRTLPLVERIVTDIVKQHKLLCRLEEQCHPAIGDEGEQTIDSVRIQYDAALDRLQDLVDELAGVGCQLKDFRRGLVDFLSVHDGRPIELCWRLGEKKICHWHELGAGFPGRQCIDREFLQDIADTAACPHS